MHSYFLQYNGIDNDTVSFSLFPPCLSRLCLFGGRTGIETPESDGDVMNYGNQRARNNGRAPADRRGNSLFDIRCE